MDDRAWNEWERLIISQGILIDRSKGSAHPRYPNLIYPVDYGFIPGTVGGDGAEIDIFAGEAETGLIGHFLTEDALKGDREIKLLWNVTEDDIAAIGRLLNTGSMKATLIRRPKSYHPPAPRTFGELLDRLGWLDEDLEDFMRDRPMNTDVLEERNLFMEDDEDGFGDCRPG